MPVLLPMLASAGDHVPIGEEWVHEVKWDGVRALASYDPSTRAGGAGGGRARFTNRTGKPLAARWPQPSGGPLARDLVVDGEIIALNERGLPDFRAFTSDVAVIYMVFDLLRLDGEDLFHLPLSERRARLEDLDLGGWQVPPQYDDGPMLHTATLEQGLEGIVSKRRDSTYRPGERTRHWLKFPHRHRASYVVGGWRPQTGTRDRLGSLLVGELTPRGLLYRGRVGSGIGPRQVPALAERLAGLTRATSPFADEVPRPDAAGTTWVEPELVVDVDSHAVGQDRLRQPSYQGIRSDLTPADLL